MKETRKQVYARYGIQYEKGKILAPNGIWVVPFLKQGNSKTGKKVYTFSTLATNKEYETKYGIVKGTCPCKCEGCYATKGCYNFPSVVNSLALNTIMVRQYMHFVENAILAQLETLKSVNEIRIFASGDFQLFDNNGIYQLFNNGIIRNGLTLNDYYVEMWKRIIKAFPDKYFWTYTKVSKYVNAFDDLKNANIVKSVINGIGYNFGKVEYILDTYYKLQKLGVDVYICRCGIDENQHCHGCHSCSKHSVVLFLEHSTGYDATTSPRYGELVQIIMSQPNESN